MRKICVVITARPSYSRVQSVLRAIQQTANLDLSLVVTASALLERYGRVSDQIEADGFDIYRKVYTVVEGDSPLVMAKTTGLAVIELSSVFDELSPDIVLTIADRYETLATSIAAAYMGIPLVHLQGGEITGSIDERVRHSITKLADYHFVCTEKARSNVRQMGENLNSIFLTGCPSIDIAKVVKDSHSSSFDLFSIYSGVGPILDLNKGFIIVLLHPVTFEHSQADDQTTILLKVLVEIGINVVWFWPNVDAGSDGVSRAIRRYREQYKSMPIHFIKNLRPDDFLSLLLDSSCIVGNSSVAIRECSFLGVPAVNIGSRQQYRERGDNVIDCDFETFSIRSSILLALKKKRLESSKVYGEGNSGEKIASLLLEIDLENTRRQKHFEQLNYSE